MSKLYESEALKIAQEVIKSEVSAINSLKKNLDKNLYLLCNVIYNCKGKLIIIGVGKSGHIANKLAATFSSTGTPSFFVHPSEAMHGDIGVISKKDTILLISNSGCTPEIISILPNLKQIGCSILSLCGSKKSRIYEDSDISLSINIKKEACPLNLAPTSSTSVTLVLGDIIAIILMNMRNFKPEEFAKNHPGGRLGKNLNLKIKDIMRSGKDIPLIKNQEKLKDVLIEMTNKNMGCVIIADHKNNAVGFFTDGDLRRAINKLLDIHETPIEKIMTKKFLTCSAEDYAADVLDLMNHNKINSLPVLDIKNKIIGVINMHILMETGIN
ncbi:KpsF/GutQ family sugar-phosphate isomerase [Gammaproteobacteria bacterium]|nr:KpsF/GutQ family sugar-phosphate isomerase [Gammaproteobacteria bacterium]